MSIQLKESSNFINRELSWLRFNTRVLSEAQNPNNPLLERLKFIAIYGTNLDEFYMVRVAGLKRLYAARITESGADRLTPKEQLEEIRGYLKKEKKLLETCYFEIKESLNKLGLCIKTYKETNKEQQKQLQDYFMNHLYPIVVPIAVDATHPFPHLNNLSYVLALKLQSLDNPNEIKFGMTRISRMLPGFIKLGDTYVLTDSVVAEFTSELFPGFSVLSWTAFRVTRNADMEIEEEEGDDFMALMTEGLKSRRKGEIIRLEIAKTKDEELKRFITNYIPVSSEDIYECELPMNSNILWEIVGNKNFAQLTFPNYTPKILPPLDPNANIFSILDTQDVLSFQPYESFDPVVNFIQSAAKDPDVFSIRMTLYRVGKNSPIVKALIEAAENGKQVTALVELKARFDEENNLHWAKALEGAGAHVIYGVPGLKVHAKIALVIKSIGKELREYVHLSTGNYNTSSAKIYTDISYMTSKKEFTQDATKFFHNLSGFSHKSRLNTLLAAPLQIKPKIIELIENEAKKGSEGRIILKANSIVDTDVIVALYKASNAGVKIDLIVRGICCLKPKVKGVSENIRVISIVGKYLEHARIYYFKHAKPQIYFASADLMPRNLERRVELMTPVFEEALAEKLFGIIRLQSEDNTNAHELQEDGEYKKLVSNGKNINSQKILEDYTNTTYTSLKREEEEIKAKRLARRMFRES
ncbi:MULTISPECIES: RNA degradosome polyphosphate kinase [Helicobacter]|uniref:Polyphosphate kinase n=1 Tax=Helicobacter colisuis TaxID=2949739 RepID=A0ABT0TVZ8_9HELI|nr:MULTISPECIES: RNA degradosome polyphosphate kinase [Helicobacter]MCI2236619.1 RNA degradosome polyphosphate kinase [Helicobacter sp. CaF467b]MCL9820014.1 RNA degradosome polyphosphate kinase [Helicobacter colisuis]MCL9822005.1 RNA degradosome polyphosphate kinase [Helicobacter colisuis]MDY4427334.1 RNA degradosome polyphosphate kinase [Helicobacter sp.]MDY5615943.1 RNA degradosome polyphosphate kinase [Helicobacter sp.]